MEFYTLKKFEQKDIEAAFEDIDKHKEHILQLLKNDYELKFVEKMKRIYEKIENDFYKNIFIKK